MSKRTYEASLPLHFKDRYRDIPIGAVVAVGAAAVELALRWRSELWPAIPVVFAMVDEIDFARLQPPPAQTDTIVKSTAGGLDQGGTCAGAWT
jgi:hypothetical protein